MKILERRKNIIETVAEEDAEINHIFVAPDVDRRMRRSLIQALNSRFHTLSQKKVKNSHFSTIECEQSS